MKFSWLIVVVVAFCSPGCGSATSSDQANIQGMWTIVYEVEDGQRREPKDSVMEFAGEKCRMRYGAAAKPKPDLEFKLDASKSPKWFEMREQGEESPFYGIYELKGDELKICVNERSKSAADRVVEFKAEPPRPEFLIVLRRGGK